MITLFLTLHFAVIGSIKSKVVYERVFLFFLTHERVFLYHLVSNIKISIN